MVQNFLSLMGEGRVDGKKKFKGKSLLPGSSFRIPYHYRFSMGTYLKNDPYTYTVSGGNGRVF